MTIYFSKQGYQLHLKKTDELEKELREIRGETHNMHESEGESLESTPASNSIQQGAMPLEERLQKLHAEKEAAQIIEYPKKVDVVCIGCTVDLKIDGKLGRYDILGYGETGSYKNAIAYSSPIVTAILGKIPGYTCVPKINDTYKTIELLGLYPLEENNNNGNGK
jgi:transcription elongation GreA/GreB family factor